MNAAIDHTSLPPANRLIMVSLTAPISIRVRLHRFETISTYLMSKISTAFFGMPASSLSR